MHLLPLAFVGLAAAIPASNLNDLLARQDNPLLLPRDPPSPTAPWVEVNNEGQPQTTHTPSISTISDSSETTLIDGAPHDLTATVYTETWFGEIETRTGDPPNPTPTAKHNEGAFTRCFNMDGEDAPFCAPARDGTLFTDKTYYVTWDPDFFNKSSNPAINPSLNRTLEISLRLDYYNTTDESWTLLDDIDSPSDRVPAHWGYFPFKASKKYHMGWQKGTTNLTITLVSSITGSKEKNETDVKLPVVLMKHTPPEDKPAGVPKGQTLYIALPAVFGSIILLVIGGCLWNRKTRRIQLGNVMGRNRRGYTGRSTRRVFASNRGRKDDEISMDVRSINGGPVGGGEYHDEPQVRATDDDLGSMAGTPVEDRFRAQDLGGNGGNAFRDEIERQRRER